MLVLLSALFVAAAIAPVLIRVIGRAAFGLLALVPLAGCGWVLHLFAAGTFEHGGAVTRHIEWMPAAHLSIDFRLDALGGLFSLIVLGVGFLVLLYCWGYFDTAPRRLEMFGAQMTLFATVMFGLVSADSFLLMYVFWEITSLLSFLLVSYYGERASSRRSAMQALMVTALGGLTMLVGLVLMGLSTGAWSFSELTDKPHLADTPGLVVAAVLVLVGALTKSALAPAHFWLPGAMAAPTPVSAYLHSAAMVKAGIYLVARLAPQLHEIPSWHLALLPIAIFTMLLGGWMSLKQKDLKLILAYGTVSQLGFIMSVVAIGSREAMLAGLALTFAHSFFKAALFMITGAIDHTAGTRDITQLSGLGRRQPVLYAIAIISAASMAGVPPLLGFVTKETVLEAVMHEDLLVGMPRAMLLVGMVAGSILTMAYALRFLWGAFATKDPDHPTGGGVSEAVDQMHEIGPMLWLPPTVLTALTVVLGVFPQPLSAIINQDLDARFGPAAESTELALWHGLTPTLGISAGIIVLGAVMHWQRSVVARAQFDYPALGSADDAYDTVLATARKISLHLTASTQRGSLTLNLVTIFCTLIVVPLTAAIVGELDDVRMIVAENPWQILAAVIIIAAAVTATVLDNRLSAVIVVGISGYALSFLFILHGAPDLALTQLLSETLIMVLFMLVLRKMPASTPQTHDPERTRKRAWLSVTVGVVVPLIGLFAMNARNAHPISEYMPELAKSIGHGDNTVNVLLVDLRGWDTMGEMTVLAIAATGVASLIFRTQSFNRESRRPTLRVTGRRWLAAEPETEQQANRSLMIEVSTRLLFPSMIALSVYFFFAGHNAPGGGFAGGLVAALAFTLRYLAGGRHELDEALPIDAGRILGLGILLSLTAVIVPMFFGRPPLSSEVAEFSVPLIGEVHVPSALVFDLGVYMVVVGLIVAVMGALGAKLDQEEDIRKQRARDRARSLARRRKRHIGNNVVNPSSPATETDPAAPDQKRLQLTAVGAARKDSVVGADGKVLGRADPDSGGTVSHPRGSDTEPGTPRGDQEETEIQQHPNTDSTGKET